MKRYKSDGKGGFTDEYETVIPSDEEIDKMMKGQQDYMFRGLEFNFKTHQLERV